MTTQKRDSSSIRTLAARLELERSSLLCVQLAHALGYQVGGRPGCVKLVKSAARPAAVYFSVDVLIADLLRDARKLAGSL